MCQALRQLRHNQWLYLVHALSLLAPGYELPVVSADQIKPKDVSQWSEEELKLLIEEGRRQSDRQQADLRDIRSRAQWLFTVAAAALGALGAGLASGHPDTTQAILWLAGLVLLVYGVGGAASVMVSRRFQDDPHGGAERGAATN